MASTSNSLVGSEGTGITLPIGAPVEWHGRQDEFGSTQVKKGRHRRFEEARALKRSTEPRVEPCPECGAAPGDEHASWCLYEESLDEAGDDEDDDDR
jgi:hypothetical protein